MHELGGFSLSATAADEGCWPDGRQQGPGALLGWERWQGGEWLLQVNLQGEAGELLS